MRVDVVSFAVASFTSSADFQQFIVQEVAHIITGDVVEQDDTFPELLGLSLATAQGDQRTGDYSLSSGDRLEGFWCALDQIEIPTPFPAPVLGIFDQFRIGLIATSPSV